MGAVTFALVYFFSCNGTVSTISGEKLNHLLSILKKGTVILSPWLKMQGYSVDLIRRYRKSNWLESIGHGAMIRSGDTIDYFGGLFFDFFYIQNSLQKYDLCVYNKTDGRNP